MAASPDAPPVGRWWSSTWFKLTLSVALLLFLLHKTDLSDLGRAVARAQEGWLAAGLVAFMASMVLACYRWTMLARPLGFTEPLGSFFGSYFTGMYMNLFAPSTVAGDIGRALFLAGGKRRALAFTTVLADRGLGFVVLSWVGALAILMQPGYRLPALLYYAAWTVPPGTLLGWLYLPQLVVRVFPPGNRWREMVEHDLAPYWSDFRLLTKTSAVAAVFHCMQIGSQVLLAWALGLRPPVGFFLIFVPVVNIIGMLPITFSGIGIRELLYRWFLGKVGVDPDVAVALGLLSSAVVLTTGLTSGLVFLFWKPPAATAGASSTQQDTTPKDAEPAGTAPVIAPS